MGVVEGLSDIDAREVREAREMAPDPAVRNPLLRVLGWRPSMTLIDPLQYGPLCYYRALGKRVYYVNDPDMIKTVLVDRRDNYPKSISYHHNLSPIIGDGLLVSDGDFWRRQRQMSQPAFHQRRIQRFTEVMAESSEALVARWRARPDPAAPVDIAATMTGLTLDIIAKTMFSTDVTGDVAAIGQAMDVVQRALGRFRLYSFFNIPQWLTRPRSRAFRDALRYLDSVVYGAIERHRAQAGERDDLVSLLLAAQDDADGSGMTDRQLRDELMTILIAGHETTAHGLVWTFVQLDRHPEIVARLAADSRAALSGRAPRYADLARVPYAMMVFREAIRLYPPAYIVARTAAADDRLQGYRIPAGSIVYVSPYIMHRHPKYWPEPERFDPERFRDDPLGHADRYVYLPFGGGPRTCIGANFAQIEAQIALATIGQAFAVEILPGQNVEPLPAITLRPGGPINARLRPFT